jgi:hypothetical protein
VPEMSQQQMKMKEEIKMKNHIVAIGQIDKMT